MAGYPKIDGEWNILFILFQWMIWGYPHFGKLQTEDGTESYVGLLTTDGAFLGFAEAPILTETSSRVEFPQVLDFSGKTRIIIFSKSKLCPLTCKKHAPKKVPFQRGQFA